LSQYVVAGNVQATIHKLKEAGATAATPGLSAALSAAGYANPSFIIGEL